MVDRKKVIKALELCYSTPPETKKCSECPYDGILRCSEQMHKEALALLKKEEPKEPKEPLDVNGDNLCPNDECHETIFRFMNFCPICGQPIAWS